MRTDIDVRLGLVVDRVGEKVFKDMMKSISDQTRKLKSEMNKEIKDIQSSFNVRKKPKEKMTLDEARTFAQADPHFQKLQRNYNNLAEQKGLFQKKLKDGLPKLEEERRQVTETTRVGGTLYKSTKDQTYVQGKLTNEIEKTTSKAAPFRMEMLSVMFMGMQLSRVFSGVTRDAMSWGGGMDYVSDMLKVNTYEVLEPFNDALFALGDWIAKNPWTGWIAPIGEIGSGFMVWVSQIVLFKDSLDKMKEWESIKDLKKHIGEVWDGFKKIITGDFSPITNVLTSIGKKISSIKNDIVGWATHLKEDVTKALQTFKDSELWQAIVGKVAAIKAAFISLGAWMKANPLNVLITIGIAWLGWEIGKYIVEAIWANAPIARELQRTGGPLATGAAIAVGIGELVSAIASGNATIPAYSPGLFTYQPGLNVTEFQQYQTGGIVPGPIGAPQMAMVHGGETIVPAGEGGGLVERAINVNVYANVSKDVDINKLANVISQKLYLESRRYGV